MSTQKSFTKFYALLMFGDYNSFLLTIIAIKSLFKAYHCVNKSKIFCNLATKAGKIPSYVIKIEMTDNLPYHKDV